MTTGTCPKCGKEVTYQWHIAENHRCGRLQARAGTVPILDKMSGENSANGHGSRNFRAGGHKTSSRMYDGLRAMEGSGQ